MDIGVVLEDGILHRQLVEIGVEEGEDPFRKLGRPVEVHVVGCGKKRTGLTTDGIIGEETRMCYRSLLMTVVQELLLHVISV